MAEALIQLVNQNVDIDGLTANEADVFDGATFIGQGSEAIRQKSAVMYFQDPALLSGMLLSVSRSSYQVL